MMYTQEFYRSIPEFITLVGNGNTRNNMGSYIDSCEYVIRFNCFEIDGYEQHVGSKTDAIFYNSISLSNTPHFEKYSLTKIPIFTHNITQRDRIITRQKETELFAQTPIFQGRRLSSGCVLALTLSLFFEKKVELIGFDFFETSHYYEPERKLSPAHDGHWEKEMLQKIKTITIR